MRTLSRVAVVVVSVLLASPARPSFAEPDPAAARAELVAKVLSGPSDVRKAAIRQLLTDDKDGEGVKAVAGTLAVLEKEKDASAEIEVVRALGRPGLVGAVPGLCSVLDSKDELVRGNTAVSLEYVGDASAVAALLARLDREKSEIVLCHVLRALGRCGKGDAKVRTVLDKRVTSSKNEAVSCAAVVGLANFAGDGAAARTMEDQLQKVGPPAFGRRGGGGENSLKRSYLAWGIAVVGDKKSGPFVREKLMKPLGHVVGGPLVDGVFAFYTAVAEVCEGKADSMAAVEGGVRTVLGMYGNPLADECRKGRGDAGYTPLAEW